MFASTAVRWCHQRIYQQSWANTYERGMLLWLSLQALSDGGLSDKEVRRAGTTERKGEWAIHPIGPIAIIRREHPEGRRLSPLLTIPTTAAAALQVGVWAGRTGCLCRFWVAAAILQERSMADRCWYDSIARAMEACQNAENNCQLDNGRPMALLLTPQGCFIR